MKKLLFTFAVVVIFGSLMATDYINFRAVLVLRQDIKTLNHNNVQLIQVNEYLSKKMGEMAGVIVKKAEWDQKVADKIRELDVQVKGLYGQTNQIISGPVH